MSTKPLKLRRSATPGKAPTLAQLALGELGLNTYDGKVYFKKNVSGTESLVTILTDSVSSSIVTHSTPTTDNLFDELTYGFDPSGSKIIASDGAPQDMYGVVIATNDSKIVIGSYMDDNVGSNSGAAYVYNLDKTNEIKIIPSDSADGDYFGSAVAINSTKIVIGSPRSEIGGTVTGAVYIYDLDGTNEIKISPTNGNTNDFFGESVAINENKIVVGSSGDDENGTDSGAIFIYDLDGTNEVKIVSSDIAASDYFGASIAVDEDKIVVGATGDDDNGSSSGSVYVYDLDGTNEIKITASDGTSSDYFGKTVDVGNGKIVVGTPILDNGVVYIYDLDGTNEIRVVASNGEDNDYFGTSVNVNDNKIIVGADANNTQDRPGFAYIYDLDGNNETIIESGDGGGGDCFGGAVAISSDIVFVGSYYNESNGSVYRYNVIPLSEHQKVAVEASNAYTDIEINKVKVDAQILIAEHPKVAIADQTIFVVTGKVFTTNVCEVYTNRLRDRKSEYTVTDDGTDTTITFTDGRSANDKIDIVTHK